MIRSMKDWYFPLRRVRQVDHHGCGIAAVAAICGVTYGRAKYEFFPNTRDIKDDNEMCVSPSQMRRVIRQLGFSVAVGCHRQHKRPAVVTFSWYPEPWTAIHAVVWDPFKQTYIDPSDGDHAMKRSNMYYDEMINASNYEALIVTGRT